MSTATATPVESGTLTGFENAEFKMGAVPLSKIRLGKYSLRDADRNSEDYQRLRDSIAASQGPMMAILVREIDDPENPGQQAYGLIDGLQRFSCSQDLGFKDIPARIVDWDAAEVASAQIIANNSRINTKPVEYTNQLHRMLNANPTLTLEELSERLHTSVKWLKDRLSIAKLHPSIGPLVDEGKIPLAHAYAMVKLKPMEEQLAFVEQAQTQGIQEFSGYVQNRVKALREAARAGRAEPSNEFQAVPHMRNLREIKEEFNSKTVVKKVLAEMKATTPEEGFNAGVAWVLSMDPTSIVLAKQQAEDRKKKDSEEKEKKKKESLAKKAENARKAALAAGIDVNVPTEGTDDEDEDEDDGE